MEEQQGGNEGDAVVQPDQGEQVQQEPQQEPQPGGDQVQQPTTPAPDTAPPAEGENQ
jgi:hypothetical protein